MDFLGEQVWAAARAGAAALFDGSCVIYELAAGSLDGTLYAEGWRQTMTGPCHLQLLAASPTEGADGAKPQGRARLFLPPDLGPRLKPGSRVVVSQQGQQYRLGECGLAVCWPSHCQVELVLLDD